MRNLQRRLVRVAAAAVAVIGFFMSFSASHATVIRYDFTASIIGGNASVPLNEEVTGSITATAVESSPGGFGIKYDLIHATLGSNSLGSLDFAVSPTGGALTINNDRTPTIDDFIGGPGGVIGVDISAVSLVLRDDDGTTLAHTSVAGRHF